jgi:hypothetical protein
LEAPLRRRRGAPPAASVRAVAAGHSAHFLCPLPLPVRAPAPAPGEPVLESLRWVAPRAILASLLSVGGGGDGEEQREEEDVLYMGITWSSWDGAAGSAPKGLAVSELGVVYMGVGEDKGGADLGGGSRQWGRGVGPGREVAALGPRPAARQRWEQEVKQAAAVS